MEHSVEGRLYGHFVLQLEHLGDEIPPALDVLALPFKNMPLFSCEDIVEWKSPELITDLSIELTLGQRWYIDGLEVMAKSSDKDVVLALLAHLLQSPTPISKMQGRRLVLDRRYAMTFAC